MYKKPFQKFLIATIAFTVFEYIVSLVLEMLFGLRWWDYSNDFLNIQGRVSLLYSIFWGIAGVILLEKLHPFIQNKLQNIVEVNLATIMIYTIEITKCHKKSEIKENFYSYKIGPRTVLVEKCTGRFLNKYNDYIDKAIVYTK